MQYARFIGRVGALAVALGIGVAAPAVAIADPDDEGTGDTSTGTAGTAGEDKTPTSTSKGDALAAVNGRVVGDRHGKPGGKAPVGSESDGSESPSATTSAISVGSSPPVTVRSSGGAHTSEAGRELGNDGEAEGTYPPSDVLEPGVHDEGDVAPPTESGADDSTESTCDRVRADERDRVASPTTAVTSTTVVIRTGADSKPDEAPEQVPSSVGAAPSEPAATEQVDKPSGKATLPPAPVAAQPATLLDPAGEVPNDPAPPVGSPVFEAMVAAYRRMDSQPDSPPTSLAAATTALAETEEPMLGHADALAFPAAPATGGDASLAHTVNSDWGSGYVASVSVTAGESDLEGWTVEFDTPAEITNIWSAEIVSHVDDHYVLANAAWNEHVAAGESVTFGYQATGDSSEISGFVVNGQSVGGDSEPTVSDLSVSNATVAESDNGTTQLDFTVTLSEATDETVTVDYTTTDGTATAVSDYLASAGTVTFTAGQTTQHITVDVLGDTTVETDETSPSRCRTPPAPPSPTPPPPAPSPTTTQTHPSQVMRRSTTR